MRPLLRRQERLLRHLFINRARGLACPFFLIIALFLLFPPSSAYCKEASQEKSIRIAILPFENMSGEFCPIDQLMDKVYQKLEGIVECAPREEIDKVLMDLRLRHTGFLTTKDAEHIGDRLGVQGILIGIIPLYKESPEPQIGLILKLISTEKEAPLLWMKTDLATGSDMETWFGLNKITDYNKLLDRFIEKHLSQIAFESLGP